MNVAFGVLKDIGPEHGGHSLRVVRCGRKGELHDLKEVVEAKCENRSVAAADRCDLMG